MMAARSGQTDAIRVLLDHGADVNARETWGGTTALMWAASEKHPAAVQLLASRGADLNAKSKIVHQPLPADDPKQRQPDITLAKKHLGWEPKTLLRDGLKKTIDWFRQIKLGDYRPPTPNY